MEEDQRARAAQESVKWEGTDRNEYMWLKERKRTQWRNREKDYDEAAVAHFERELCEGQDRHFSGL